ncbi:PAS domain-containing protein [Yoonia sediminilitoris]|uniref:PAS domain-containing protein n=1 Tax=Yoonia sediminilitoris TaxID=1286148 RepID=A0A2T6KEQ3_9RHOB|nr:PAS domain-containing protein [Yoonia sediminilitoris]PUB13601.1 PAS domain-containing protein [Yoonia sediminilitoris]RCW94771.1 PAS domain-containing protein [Yoonia sediminilitoris]
MYTHADHLALSAALDEFAVPMFAVERQSKDAHFRFIGVNSAHTNRSGLTNADIAGARTCDLLPPQDAETTENRYRDCVDRQTVLSYVEKLAFAGLSTIWNITLQPVTLRNGVQRIIGTASTSTDHAVTAKLEDAAYYATSAQMQVAQLRSFLEQVGKRPDLPADLRDKAIMVDGLTHSIDALLSDIRDAASKADNTNHRQTMCQFGQKR